MKASDYAVTTFGQVESDHYGNWPHGFFLPRFIGDFAVNLTDETLFAINRAERALGKVTGLSMVIAEPEILLAPSLMREALSSSRIEGTQASLSDALTANRQTGPITNENLREINNYLAALKHGAALLSELPLATRIIRATHTKLMRGVRGEEKYPGEYRKSPVWIGGGGVGPAEAAYIPPLPNHIGGLMTDLERYLNEPNNHSTVLKAALAHYQFETIHPFLDGNGRIGRLLISLLFIQDGALPQPVVNLSSYFEDYRTEYYQHLQAVREKGEINQWVQFFAQGVERQAAETAQRITTLLEIQHRYRNQVAGERSRVRDLVDVLIQNPILETATVSSLLQISTTTAGKIMQKAQTFGWVLPMNRSGRGGRQYWYAHEIWSATTTESI